MAEPAPPADTAPPDKLSVIVYAGETLLSACVEMDVAFMVCEMGLRARGLEAMPLRDDVPVRPGGLVTFLNDASKDGAILFI